MKRARDTTDDVDFSGCGVADNLILNDCQNSNQMNLKRAKF